MTAVEGLGKHGTNGYRPQNEKVTSQRGNIFKTYKKTYGTCSRLIVNNLWIITICSDFFQKKYDILC